MRPDMRPDPIHAIATVIRAMQDKTAWSIGTDTLEDARVAVDRLIEAETRARASESTAP